jgi:hypothetical protein
MKLRSDPERYMHVPIGAVLHHERGLIGTYELDGTDVDFREIPAGVTFREDRHESRVVPHGDWCRQGEGAE